MILSVRRDYIDVLRFALASGGAWSGSASAQD